MKIEKKTASYGQNTSISLLTILIVEARYYEAIGDELVKGAVARLKQAGVQYEHIIVPGALELPGAIYWAEKSGRYDGYVALGCVLRGETTHYDIVSQESARGLMDLTLHGVCVGNGVLTCENEAQALARARVTEMDKGGGAAEAALAMLHIKQQFIQPIEKNEPVK